MKRVIFFKMIFLLMLAMVFVACAGSGYQLKTDNKIRYNAASHQRKESLNARSESSWHEPR
jgi:hypothetical protein